MNTLKSVYGCARQALTELEKIDTTKIADCKLYDYATAVSQARWHLDRLLATETKEANSCDADDAQSIRANERERCAKIVESQADERWNKHYRRIASVIRNGRGET